MAASTINILCLNVPHMVKLDIPYSIDFRHCVIYWMGGPLSEYLIAFSIHSKKKKISLFFVVLLWLKEADHKIDFNFQLWSASFIFNSFKIFDEWQQASYTTILFLETFVCVFDDTNYSLRGFHVSFFISSFAVPIVCIVLMYLVMLCYLWKTSSCPLSR